MFFAYWLQCISCVISESTLHKCDCITATAAAIAMYLFKRNFNGVQNIANLHIAQKLCAHARAHTQKIIC